MLNVQVMWMYLLFTYVAYMLLSFAFMLERNKERNINVFQEAKMAYKTKQEIT